MKKIELARYIFGLLTTPLIIVVMVCVYLQIQDSPSDRDEEEGWDYFRTLGFENDPLPDGWHPPRVRPMQPWEEPC